MVIIFPFSGGFWSCLFNFAVESAASNSRSVFLGAQWDSVYFLEVSAIYTKSIIRSVWVHIFVFGLEFLAAYRRPVMHST